MSYGQTRFREIWVQDVFRRMTYIAPAPGGRQIQ